MKLHKKLFIFLILTLCISMFSVPTFAAAKKVTITIQKVNGKKVQKKYSFTVTKGKKPTKKQISTATEKAIKWLGGNYSTNKKIYSTNLKKALNKKFSKNTKINVKYTQHTYKIIFKSGGGTGAMATKTVKYNDKVKLTNAFSRKYYVFDHWAASNGKTYKNGAVVSGLTTTNNATVTITAVFVPNKNQKYKVTYDLGGGVNSTRNPYTYTYGSYFSLREPTKKSWVFDGWTGTGVPNKTKTVNVPYGSVGDRNYKAHWKAINYYIAFDASGGKGTMNKIIATSGQKITLPKIAFTKERFKFAGWDDGKGHIYNDRQSVIDILSGAGKEGAKVTLKAIWATDANANIKLTINPNGGTYDGNDSKQYKLAGVGKTITLLNPYKKGYRFVSWKCTGGGKMTNTRTYLYGNTDGTVTATWEKIK